MASEKRNPASTSGRPLHGERRNGLLHIDPFKIKRYVEIREIDYRHVDVIAESIQVYGYNDNNPITGRIIAGEVEVLDGAHRSKAVIKLIENGELPRDFTVPMIEEEVDISPITSAAFLLDSVKASNANDMASRQKRMTFIEYLNLTLDLRDGYWERNAGEKQGSSSMVTIRDVNMPSIRRWLAVGSQREDLAETVLRQPQYESCLSILRVLRPYSRIEEPNPKMVRCLWQLFCIVWGRPVEVQNNFAMKEFPTSLEKRASVGEQLFGMSTSGEIASPLCREVLTCEYFRSGRSAQGRTLTEEDKVFGRLMFMISFVHIALTRRRNAPIRRGRKRRRTGRDTETSTFAPFQRTRANGESVGVVLERVMSAWDTTAMILGFESAYMMCRPYMVFDSEKFQFICLANRTDGWAHPDHYSDLLLPSPVVKLRENAGYPGTLDISVDARLRSLTEAVLVSVYDCMIGIDVFGSSTNQMEGLRTKFFHQPDRFGLNAFIEARIEQSIALDGHERLKVWKNWNREMRVKPVDVCDLKILYETEQRNAASRSLSRERDRLESNESMQHSTRRLGTGGRKPTNDSGSQYTSSMDGRASSAMDTVMQDVAEDTPSAEAVGEEEGVPDHIVQLKKVMKRFCVAYNCTASRLVHRVNTDSIGMLSGNTIDGQAQLVLTDPPFNTRREKGKTNSDYDDINSAQMFRTGKDISRMLRPGGHALIFSSIKQLVGWGEALQNAESGEQSMRTDDVPLILSRRPYVFIQNPMNKSCSLHNIHEFVVHSFKRGMGAAAFEMVDYSLHNRDLSRHPGYVNAIDNCPKLGPGESLNFEDKRLRAEQKPLSILRELISRFSKPGDIVVDLFSGTYSTAIACMTMRDGLYRKFIGCEKDATCHGSAQPLLLDCFVRQGRDGVFGEATKNDISSILANKEWNYSIRSNVGSERLRHRSDAPDGFPSVSSLPLHMLRFVSSVARDQSMLRRLAEVPMNEWGVEDLGKVFSVDPEMMLAVHASFHNVIVAASTVREGGLGVFAAEDLERGSVVGWYNGTILYGKIGENEPQRSRLYGPDGFGCTGERFQNFNMEMETSVIGEEAPVDKIYLVPAEYNVCSYLNDSRTIDGMERVANVQRRKNAEFRVHKDVNPTCDFKYAVAKPDLILAQVVVDVRAGEEIFVDYGSRYWTAEK